MSLSDILTPRQIDIARCIARGMTKREAADELGITFWTIKQICHMDGGLYDRLEARNMVDVARAVWQAEGVTMSDTPEKPTERGWQVREDTIHWIPETIPATTSPESRAWTDYRNDDCQLRRRRPEGCEGSQQVRVASPLFPGARVKVVAREGGWEAIKDD